MVGVAINYVGEWYVVTCTLDSGCMVARPRSSRHASTVKSALDTCIHLYIAMCWVYGVILCNIHCLYRWPCAGSMVSSSVASTVCLDSNVLSLWCVWDDKGCKWNRIKHCKRHKPKCNKYFRSFKATILIISISSLCKYVCNKNYMFRWCAAVHRVQVHFQRVQ